MDAFFDYETLVTGKLTDEKKVNSRKSKNDDAVDDLGKYLSSPDNVCTYSWSTIINTYLNIKV